MDLTMGFEVILPFLRPIEALIQDSAISEIMVMGLHGSSSSGAAW